MATLNGCDVEGFLRMDDPNHANNPTIVVGGRRIAVSDTTARLLRSDKAHRPPEVQKVAASIVEALTAVLAR